MLIWNISATCVFQNNVTRNVVRNILCQQCQISKIMEKFWMTVYMPNTRICIVFISHGCHLVGMSTDTATSVHVPKLSMYCMKFPWMASRWGSGMQWVHRTVEPVDFEETSFKHYTEMILIQFFIELTREEKLTFASFRTVPWPPQ